jgi:hypothetical protein
VREDWVKAHAQLFFGYWAGVPRAHRFFLLELAHAAKPLGGHFELPFGTVDPVEGVVEMFGGTRRRSRREVREAIEFLTTNSQNGDGSRSPSVVFRREADRVVVVIPQFAVWNPSTSSADRMRRKRDRDKLQEHAPTCDVTGDNECDALEESRGEEKRGDKNKQEEVASRVWDQFVSSLARRGKRTPKRTPARIAQVRARLRDFDEATLLRAIELFTCEASWWMANNRHSPEVLFRSVEQVEKMLEREAEYARGSKRPQGSSTSAAAAVVEHARNDGGRLF